MAKQKQPNILIIWGDDIGIFALITLFQRRIMPLYSVAAYFG